MNDRAKLRKTRRAEAVQDEKINKALSALANSYDGREFLWWLLGITRWGSTTFTGNALSGAFAQGEQNIGLQIVSRLSEIDPEGFLNLLKEKANERRKDEHRDYTGEESPDGGDLGEDDLGRGDY